MRASIVPLEVEEEKVHSDRAKDKHGHPCPKTLASHPTDTLLKEPRSERETSNCQFATLVVSSSACMLCLATEEQDRELIN